MQDVNIKKLLLDECFRIQQMKADNAFEAMAEHQKMANEYGTPKDRYDSFRTQLLRKKDLFAEQYQKALDEIKILEKIDPEVIHAKVEFGSLVYTNDQRIFVATGIGKIIVNYEEFFVVSTKVPVFELMKDLNSGRKFNLNNKEFTILKIL